MMDWSATLAFLQVVLIDVSLSGDNAIIIAMAAAGLPAPQRRHAITIGIGAAIALRIVFAILTVYLLDLPGLVLAGGLMLGWVCWKMWTELRASHEAEVHHAAPMHKTLWQAVAQITVADVSMSLDNVVAVAGAARAHLYVMAAGLVISIACMAVAARLIVGLLKRWPYLSYAGLVLIAYIAVRMTYEGGAAVLAAFTSATSAAGL
jgi:YjbE family integral membrane protein